MPLKQLQLQVLLGGQTGALPIPAATTICKAEVSIANGLLLPVLAAAEQLATGAGAPEGLDTALKLVGSVCDVLMACARRGYEWAEEQLVFSELLLLMLLLQQQQEQQGNDKKWQHSQKQQMEVWLRTCAAAAGLAAAAGDLEAVDLLLQQVRQLELGGEGTAAVFSAALRSAAAGISPVCPSTRSRRAVMQLWAKLPGLSAELGKAELMKPAAAAVACAMQADASLGEVLLMKELQMQVLQQLLQGAVDAKQAVAVQLLLQQAERQQELDKLPAKLLTAAATLSVGGAKGGRGRKGSEAVGPAAAAAAGPFPSGASENAPVASQLQLLGVLLQQGEPPPAVAAAALLQSLCTTKTSGSSSNRSSSSSTSSSSVSTSSGVGFSFAELEAWLQQHVSTAPAPAAYAFLCTLLETSAEYLHPGQCWGMYKLLKQHQSAWPEELLGLTPGACNALLQQQQQLLLKGPAGLGIAGVGGDEQRPGASSGSGGDQAREARVLEVWEHFSSCMAGGQARRAVKQLIHDNQKLLLNVLVARSQHDRALALLHSVPDLLPYTVGQWMQQLKEQGQKGVAVTEQEHQRESKQLQQQEKQEQTAGEGPAAVSPGVIQNAVELMLKTGTPAAAVAAEQLVKHLLPPHGQQQQTQQQQQTAELGVIFLGRLGPPVLQLLSQHSRLSSARILLASVLQHEHRMERAMKKAVATLLCASATAAPREQESTLQLFLELWMRSGGFQNVVVDAVEQLLAKEGKRNKAGLALGVHVLEQACKNTKVEQQQQQEREGLQEQQQWLAMLTMTGRDKLTLLCCCSSHHSSSKHLQLLPSPERLAWALVCSPKCLSKDAAVTLMNTLANGQPELQPAAMANLLELLQEGATSQVDMGSAPSRQDLQAAPDAAAAAPAAARTVAAAGGVSKGGLEVGVIAVRSFLLAQMCYLQLSKAALEEGDSAAGGVAVPSIAGSLGWVAELSKETASAALFASWFWSQSAAADAGPAASFLAAVLSPLESLSGNAPKAASLSSAGFAAAAWQLSIPDGAAVGVLGLELYHASRQGKPSLESLLLDLALLSAAAAGDWNEGK